MSEPVAQPAPVGPVGLGDLAGVEVVDVFVVVRRHGGAPFREEHHRGRDHRHSAAAIHRGQEATRGDPCGVDWPGSRSHRSGSHQLQHALP